MMKPYREVIMTVSISNSPNNPHWKIPESAVPPLAASLAMFPLPICYGYAWKSARQLGTRMPSLKRIFLNSFKMAPTMGVIVGIQMAAENAFESMTRNKFEVKDNSSIKTASASSLIGALASVYPIVVVNGWTINKCMKDSLKDLTFKKSCAIVANEMCFILALKTCGLWSQRVPSSNENPLAENLRVMLSATIGTVIGHPFDTMLTCWQRQKKIENFRRLMRGVIPNIITTACFTLIYHNIEKSWIMDHGKE